MRSICENPRVKKINDRRAWARKEPIKTIGQLRAIAEEFFKDYQTMARQGGEIHRDVINTARKNYAELREAYLAVGGDINGLPRRLRIKFKGRAA